MAGLQLKVGHEPLPHFLGRGRVVFHPQGGALPGARARVSEHRRVPAAAACQRIRRHNPPGRRLL
eukprot:6542863-Prymnesium_polylepis.1